MKQSAQSLWFIVILAILSTVPLWPLTTSALGDLPAHVARYHIMETIEQSPYLSRYYVTDWRWVPNLGVDFLVSLLAPVTGLERAVHLIVTTIPAITILGMLLVARETHGRLPYTALFALPLAYAYPFIFGFVNYCFTVGLAFLGFFLCLRLTHARRPWLRSLVLAACAPLILSAHLAGFFVFGILCFGGLLGDALDRKEHPFAALLRAGFGAAPIAWPLIFILLSNNEAGGPNDGWFDVRAIATWTSGMLRTRWMVVDIASALVVIGVAGLPVLLRKRFSWSLALLIPAVILALCSVLLPRMMSGSEFASVRLISVAVALAVLAVRPRDTDWKLGWALGLAFAFTRAAILLLTLAEANRQAEAELEGLRVVKPGSRIVAFQITPCDRYWKPRYLNHIQALATVRRDAMVNDNFTDAHAQTYGLSASELAHPLPKNDVRTPGCNRPDTTAFDKAYKSADFSQVDYVWVIDSVGVPWSHDARLRQVWSHGGSAIFATDRQAR